MMDSKFNSIPDLRDSKYALDIEQQELIQWLHELSLHDSLTSLRQILCLLQKLTVLDLDPEKKISSLEKIRVSLPVFCEKLQAGNLESSFPLTQDQQTNVEIIVWVHAQLALSYLQLEGQLEGKSKETQLAIILYRCLQELGQALLAISEVYEQPYEGFWLQCYRVYAKAEKLQILDLDCAGSDENKASTINKVFKQILVFALSGTNQFRPRDMKKIFRFLAEAASPAKMFTEINQESKTGVCRFNLDRDSPPAYMQKGRDHDDEQTRFIAPVAIANMIYQLLQEKEKGRGSLQRINRALLIKLFKTLSLAQKRKYTRVTEGRDCTAVIGLRNLTNLLRKDRQDNIDITDTVYDPRIAGHWRTPELELVAVGDECAHQMLYTNKLDIKKDSQISKIFAASKAISKQSSIWESEDIARDSPGGEVDVGEFEILDSSVAGYGVLGKEKNLKARIGDVFGIVTGSDNRAEVGLIFRVDMYSEGGIRLGIKLLGMDSKAVFMTKPGRINSGVWGVLIPGVKELKSADCIVYNSSQYQPGEFVCIQQESGKRHCRLNKLLYTTAAVSYVELFYQNIEE